MASDGRIELELTVKDNASGQVNSIVSDIEHKVNRASGDVKIGLKASDEASKVIDQVKDKTEKGAEGKATLKADDQATSVINAAKENTEKGAEGKATIKADDQASDTIKTVREDYEKGAEGKATVTGDNSDAAGAMARTRTDYERGAEGKATVTGDDEATATLTGVRTDYEKGAEGKATVTGADEATETLTGVRTDFEAGAEGKATVTAQDDASTTLTSVRTDYEKGAEGKATVTGDDEATETLTSVRTDYETGAAGTATVTGDNTDASGAMARTRTDYERGAEGTAVIKGDNTGALGAISDVSEKASTVGGGTSVIKGDNTGALSDINDVSDAASNVGGGTSVIKGDNTGALGDISDVSTAARNVEGGTSVITADTSGALSAISEVQEALNNLGSTNPQVDVGGSSGGASGGGLGGGVGGFVKGVGNAAKNVMAGVFSAGMSYEDALAFASSYMPAYADADAYGHAMLDLASETGMDVSDLLGASYSALSARIKYGADEGDIGGSQLANFVGQAARVARIGQIDTNTAATVLAQMLNANGLAATDENVQRMGNILARGQEYGVNMGIGVQAGALSHVLPLWKMAGMDMEQGYAMLEGMTAGGTSFSEAVTQMRMVMLELMDESGDAGKAFKDATGMSFTDYLAGGGTIMDAITTLNTFGNGKLNDIFSNRNAIIGAGQMLNAGQFFTGNYMAMLDTQTDSVGRQYGNVTATTSFSLSRIREQFKSYGTMLYEAMAPSVRKLLDVVTGDKFQLAMARITNKISHLLSHERVGQIIDRLVDAANDLLDVISGKKSLGELLSGWMSGLKEVADQFMTWIKEGFIGMLNEILPHIPLMKDFHIETAAEREARLANAERLREAYGGEKVGNYLLNPDLLSEKDIAFIKAQEGGLTSSTPEIREAAEAAVESYLSEIAEELGVDASELYAKLTDEEMAELDQKVSSTLAGEDERQARIDQAQGVLAENEVQSYEDFARIAGASPETGTILLEAIKGLRAEGAEGFWQEAPDYGNLPYNEATAQLAGLEAGASAAGTASEDAASGMEDAARGASRLASATTPLPSALSAFTAAMASATREASSFHMPSGGEYAVGLDRVPYDNYPALLHKGEMVLTAAEASAFRFGGTGSSGGGFDVNGLASAIAGMAVQMDGKTVGRLVERSVSQEQGVRYNRQARKG